MALEDKNVPRKTLDGITTPTSIWAWNREQDRWFPAELTEDNELVVVLNPSQTKTYAELVAEGVIIGAKTFFEPGFNYDVGNTLEDVTTSGLVIIPVPAAAMPMEVVSSNAADDGEPAGANAHTVSIHGLGDGFIEQEEVIVLDGLTPVATNLDYLRINALHVETNAGHGLTAAGDIDIRDPGTPADIFNRIAAGNNMSLQAHYTVPDGKVAYITGWSAGAMAAQDILARIILRATCDWEHRINLPGVFLFQDIMAQEEATSQRQFKIPRRVPARADIKVSAQRVQGAQTIQVSCSFAGWIENE